MNFGTIVSLPGSNKHFVLVKYLTKRISGHIEEKKFYALKEKANIVDEVKPYTKARASLATIETLGNLSAGEKADFARLKKNHWEVHVN